MPELPEVETVRAGLARHVLDRRIDEVSVYRDRAVRRQGGGAAEFTARLTGQRITAAVRRGKFCWLTLSSDEALLAHLGMSGQLLIRSDDRDDSEDRADSGDDDAAPAAVRRHLRVRLRLDDGRQIWFCDQRTFGYLAVQDLVPTLDGAPGGDAGDRTAPASVPLAVAHIARDLLDPLLAPGTPGRAALNRRVRMGRRDIKRALLDQTLTSGIGNIYADEALWQARLHHRRRTDRLRAGAVDEVLDAAAGVMRQALAAGGTSFDALYVNVNGASGYFDRSLQVYGQSGRPCSRCGTLIVRETFMNRSSHLCPRCQRQRS